MMSDLSTSPKVLRDVMRRSAERYPDRKAIIANDVTVTYEQLDRRSKQVASFLRTLSFERGDRIAFLSRNRVDYFELLFGGAQLGVVMVPVNWRLAPSEIVGVLTDAQPKAIFAEESLLSELNIGNSLEGFMVILLGEDHDSWTRLIEVFPESELDVSVEGNDQMWQLYTSGTTGAPKGVMLSNSNFFSMAEGLADAWHFEPGCIVYVPYPVFHAVGTAWVVLTLLRGGTVIFRRGFDEEDFLRSVEEHGVSLTMMVPAVLNMVLNHKSINRFDLGSLKHIVYGAAPITQAVLADAIRKLPNCQFTHAYGLTEATGTVTTMQWHEHIPGTERMNSCGKPFPWVTMRIVDPNLMEDVGPRVAGEVWVKSPTVMHGYFGRPDETAEAIVEDCWLRTGDAGFVDEDGYLYLTDRVKDMVISGGENIYPAEVENVINDFPGVKEVAVIGIPHEIWGESVLAIIVRHSGVEIDPLEVVAFCRERLAHYKCPSRVEIRDESLPLNPTGKVMRRALKDPYWAGQKRLI
jgi:long-chain acyl-CoA synthetase